MPLLGCSLCADRGTNSMCEPLLVGGEVIGSVLVSLPLPFDREQDGQIKTSVAQAAPVLANLRNLAVAEFRANNDSLTGLPNRRATDDTLKRMVAQANRSFTPLSAVMFDLDHFKHINDQFGHGKGDEVLAAVGAEIVSLPARQRLRRQVRRRGVPHPAAGHQRGRRRAGRREDPHNRRRRSRCPVSIARSPPASESPSCLNMPATPSSSFEQLIARCTRQRPPGETAPSSKSLRWSESSSFLPAQGCVGAILAARGVLPHPVVLRGRDVGCRWRVAAPREAIRQR